jgi:lysophospholipid acyltransferase (LPLAT)-like uncharacterized protein
LITPFGGHHIMPRLLRHLLYVFSSLKRDARFSWFWRMVAPVVAGYMWVNAKLTLRTSSVTEYGPGACYNGTAIYVNWHKYVPFLCVHHGQHRRWLLMSGAPYLEPVALWCRWMGLTVVRGSPGQRSRELLGDLLQGLKNGNSVALAADGPAGPGFIAKPGCVELAHAAGMPIIPVACRSRKGRSNPKRWDHFYTVSKFDRIEVWCGEPLFLSPSENERDALARVQRGLEELESIVGN